MTLRRRTFTMMAVLLIVMTVILFIALQQIILTGFESVERSQAIRNVWRAQYALVEMRNKLLLGLQDWSSWDDAYEFALGNNPTFIEDNVNQDVLSYLELDFMLVLDRSGDVRLWSVSDAHADQSDALRAALAGEINPQLSQTILAQAPQAFYVIVDDTPLVVAVRPVLPTGGKGTPSGMFLWGRAIDSRLLASISEILRLDISVKVSDQAAEGDAASGSSTSAVDASPPAQELTYTDDTVVGSLALPTLGGNMTIMVHQVREILQQARVSLWRFTAAMLIFGGILIASALFLINRLILRRVSRLSGAVEQIGKTDGTSSIPVDGSDELGVLTRAINTMIEETSSSRAALQRLNAALEERVAERTVELEAQQAQLRAIVDTMGEGLIYCIDGIITVVNPTVADMAGYSASELIGKPFKALTPKIDMTVTQNLPRKPDRYETKLVRRDGSTLEVAVTATPVQMGDGKRRRVIILRDITQEAAMKRQKDYFFARASHELRTPLSNIMTRLYLLERDPEQFSRHMAVLNKVSRQMHTLLNDLLTVSRLENTIALEKRQLDLRDVLREVVDVQHSDAEIKHISVTAKLPDAPLPVYVDPTRINQVFTNLVRNAVIYTPENGSVSVTAEILPDEHEVVVRVEDNGIGIEATHLPHLFDPFFRVSEGGSGAGLGLYITREIVDLHEGRIGVESTPGVGTTFSVRLHLDNAATLVGAAMD